MISPENTVVALDPHLRFTAANDYLRILSCSIESDTRFNSIHYYANNQTKGDCRKDSYMKNGGCLYRVRPESQLSSSLLATRRKEKKEMLQMRKSDVDYHQGILDGFRYVMILSFVITESFI